MKEKIKIKPSPSPSNLNSNSTKPNIILQLRRIVKLKIMYNLTILPEILSEDPSRVQSSRERVMENERNYEENYTKESSI
jgi:hypothetical protein